MSLPPLVPVSELEIALELDEGSLDGAPLARAEQALRRVSALIRAEAGKTWVDADGVTITAPEDVLSVALEATLRPYRNPEGQASESVGDYAVTFAQTGDPIGFYLSDEDKRIVRRAALGVAGPGFSGSIRTPSAYPDPAADGVNLSWGL